MVRLGLIAAASIYAGIAHFDLSGGILLKPAFAEPLLFEKAAGAGEVQSSFHSRGISPKPPNDDFANREILPSTNVVNVTSPFFGATREVDEPGTANSSVWWQWVAPETGSFALEVFSHYFSPAVEVFVGDDLKSLIQVSPQIGGIRIARTGLRVVAGTTYMIRADAPAASSGDVHLELYPGPVNDDFLNAIPLSGDPVGTGGYLAGATFEQGEDIFSNNFGASIWWRWIPDESGVYAAWVEFNEGDVALAAYRGKSLDDLNIVAKAFSEKDQARAQIDFYAEAGEELYLKVANYPVNGAGFYLQIWGPPDNDDFEEAMGVEEFASSATYGATVQAGEPGTEFSERSVWFHWRPDHAGRYEFELSGGLSGNILSFYEGESLGSLNLVRRIYAPPSEEGFTNLFADLSESVFLAVTSLDPGGDIFDLWITPAPPNDNFSNREKIQGTTTKILANTAGASREPDEPAHDPSNPSYTMWWEWTAPSTGGYYVELAALKLPPWLKVYQGDSLRDLEIVPSEAVFTASGDPYYITSTTFRARAGESYLFLVYDGKPGSFEMSVVQGPPHDEFENALNVFLDAEIVKEIPGATFQPGEPDHKSAGTVWHQFTAPSSGTYVARGNGGLRGVFRGSALKNLSPAGFSPAIIHDGDYPFRASAGETVFISVGNSYAGSYRLLIVRGAENDDFGNRLAIESESIIEHSAWSTLEPGEPIHNANNFGGSVWWKWIPTSSALFRIKLVTPHSGFGLAVYQGSELANLAVVAKIEPFDVARTYVDVFAEAGFEYAISSSCQLPWADARLTVKIYPVPQHIQVPELTLIRDDEGWIVLTFPLEADRVATVDISPDLVTWEPWTSVLAPSTTTHRLAVPNSAVRGQFFRLRVEQ